MAGVTFTRMCVQCYCQATALQRDVFDIRTETKSGVSAYIACVRIRNASQDSIRSFSIQLYNQATGGGVHACQPHLFASMMPIEVWGFLF